MDLFDFGVVAFLAALCVAFVELVKQAGLPSRFAGVAALVAGITLSLIGGAAGRVEGDYWELVLIGIMVGLTAAGLWSAPKAVIAGKQSNT